MMQVLFTIFRKNCIKPSDADNYFVIPQSSSYVTDIACRFQLLLPGSYNGSPYNILQAKRHDFIIRVIIKFQSVTYFQRAASPVKQLWNQREFSFIQTILLLKPGLKICCFSWILCSFHGTAPLVD